MFQLLFLMSFIGPIYMLGKLTCSDPDWSLFGTSCYKIIEGEFNYAVATQTCHAYGGYIIMPKTEVEINYFKTFVQDRDEFADCVRLKEDGKLWDMGCSASYKTICQRDADQETTSIIDITSSLEITTTDAITSDSPILTTETDPLGPTTAELSTDANISVESSTRSNAPKVLSTSSYGIVTNSTEHCNWLFVCSNHVNKTQGSQGFIYKVDTKQLSSYKRKHQSAWDPRKSSLYIGSVGIAVLVLTIMLIMFLDCVPTKV
ncbi:unnamed protein product [Mytilus edulis]|uniref:C-type lectin domain-containing protein n=1 Tax=Mytilus edulis TaxID=6550 RepID=A0A8S3QJL6_MYTED|nr:unnamed protein product [Mytilus edulis]